MEFDLKTSESLESDQRIIEVPRAGSLAFQYDAGLNHLNMSPSSNNIILISHEDMSEEGSNNMEDSAEIKQLM